MKIVAWRSSSRRSSSLVKTVNRRFVARTLLIVAFLEAVLVTAYWTAAGANTGWTKNRVEVILLDEVTGLDGRTWENRFVPGVELLAASLLSGVVLITLAITIRKPKTTY